MADELGSDPGRDAVGGPRENVSPMNAASAVPPHPYRAVWETRDLKQWEEALAPDVVLHSPIILSPFRGRAAAVELFDVLLETLDEFVIKHEFVDSRRHVFLWSATISGREIEGCDVITADDDDRICDITVLIRPLVGLGTFAGAMGPALARRRGAFRGLIARVLIAGLKVFLGTADALSTWLVGKGRGHAKT